MQGCILWTDFRRSPHYQVSRKSVHLIAALIHADRQTDRHDEANMRFSLLTRKRLKLEEERGNKTGD
jgi:hypothetical protein